MAELYNQVRQSNSKYIPKFVGSNFDTLKAVGETLQDRYRRNKDLSDSLAIQIANDRYFDKDKHIGDKHYNNLNKVIEEVSSSDPNFENSGQVISQAVKDYATDRARIAALDNHKRYEQYLDLKHKLGSKAVDFTERRNKDFFNQGTVNEDGSVNRFEHALEERLDYNAPKEKLFNDIEPDLIPLISKYNPATGQIEGGVTETNKAKIRNYLGQAFARYKQDAQSEYNQEKEVLLNQGIPENQVDAYIAKSIVDVGQEKVLDRTRKTGENASHAFLKGLFGDEQQSSPTTGTTPGHPVINTSNQETLVDNHDTTREMNDQEKKEYVKQYGSSTIGGGSLGAGSAPIQYPKVQVKGKPETEPGSYAYNYNQLANNAPEELKRQGINSIESYKKAFEEAKKNNEIHTPTAFPIAQKQAALYNDFLNRYAGSQHAITSDDSTVKSLNSIIGEVAENLEKGDKLDIVPTVIAPQLANKDWEGGALGFDIKVNGVSKKTGYVKLNDQVSQIANPISLVNQLSRNRGFDEGENGQGSNKNNPILLQDYAQKEANGNFIIPTVYTVTVPTKNGKGKAKFKTTVYSGVQELSPDGQKLGEPKDYVPMDIDQWNIRAWDQFVAPKLSKLIGSGQAVNNQDLKLFASDAEEE